MGWRRRMSDWALSLQKLKNHHYEYDKQYQRRWLHAYLILNKELKFLEIDLDIFFPPFLIVDILQNNSWICICLYIIFQTKKPTPRKLWSTNMPLSSHELQSLLLTKTTQTKSHSTVRTSIHTHRLLELPKTSTTEPHLRHGKPTVVSGSIGPAVNALQLLAVRGNSGGFHLLLIQLCWHLFFPSCPAVYLAPVPLLSPRPRTSSLPLSQAASHSRCWWHASGALSPRSH